MKRAFALVLVAGLCGVVVAAVGVSLWKAARAVEQSKDAVRTEAQFAVRTVALDKPPSDGFEFLNSPAQLRRAALFGNRLYICSASGLLAFDLDGTLRARYSVGKDLPAAPLVDMAVGLGPSAQPELWIATAGAGLVSFDGSHFVQIRSEEGAARALTTVLPLATGRVLLGTEKRGVLVWDGKTLAPVHPALGGIAVAALAGSEADLWVGTLDRGVFHWHAGQLDTFSEGQGLPDPRVLSLAVDGEKAFVGTALGVAEFRGGRFSRVLAEGYFAKALNARRDSLVIGTLEEGLLGVPLASERPRPRVARNAENFGAVAQVFEMEGRAYALTDMGLFEASSSGGVYQAVLERPRAALADGNISALAVDAAGRLWVGYFDRGLDILEPGLDRARHIEDQHLFCVNRIAHERDGGLSAVGTANGLVLFDAAGQQKQVVTKSEGLIANNVSDVLLRGEGGARSITVATPAGLTTLDGAGTTSIYAFHGLVSNHAYALGAAGSRLLVGTLGGLSIVDSGLVSASFTTANSGLKHNWITAIVPVANEWFIGTYGAGIVKLDSTGHWTTFPDLRPPLEINPNAMVADERAVYAGTLGRGLAVYRQASGRWTMLQRGLPSSNVTALALGGGYLYIGTDNGLVRIPERSVLAQ